MESQQTDTDDLTGADESGRSRKGWRTSRLDAFLVSWVALAAALFVGSAVYAGAVLQPFMADRTAVAAKQEVARVAAAAVSALWTYTPDTIDTLPQRAAEYLSADLHAQYRRFLEAAVMPNKQAQITDQTNVVGVAVESLTGRHAVALVLTNTTATSPLTHDIPSLKYVAYRLAMDKEGSRWWVANLATISFMDLTPKL